MNGFLSRPTIGVGTCKKVSLQKINYKAWKGKRKNEHAYRPMPRFTRHTALAGLAGWPGALHIDGNVCQLTISLNANDRYNEERSHQDILGSLRVFANEQVPRFLELLCCLLETRQRTLEFPRGRTVSSIGIGAGRTHLWLVWRLALV